MRLFFLVTLLSLTANAQLKPLKKPLEKPKLVVVLVVDQLRADYMSRFNSRFLPAKTKNGVGGFKFLTTQGAFFPAAQYSVLQSMTCPGHAMILSGAHPAVNGVILNEWYDKVQRKVVYCADDPEFGVSAKNLKTTTVGDELKLAGYKSKVVGIALKDRSAIMLTGHNPDHVFWLNQKDYQWKTSKKYSPDESVPAWVQAQNAAIKKSVGSEYEWKSNTKPTGFSEKSDFPFVRKYKLGERQALSSPYGADITLTLAAEAVKNLKLGKGPHTDILAVSLSSHDALGHQFGPNSQEMEEMTISEDQLLSKFFTGLQAQGVLNNSIIILTADHGVAPAVEYAQKMKIEAGKIDYLPIFKKLNTHLDNKYGRPKNNQWFASFIDFNFYFDRASLAERKVDIADAELETKKILLDEPGVWHVLTSSEYRKGVMPVGFLGTYANNQYNIELSGDVVIIPRPFHVEKTESTATHVTGYSYDRTVPLVFWGKGFQPGVYPYQADIIDIAPTLSFYLGVLPPAMSHGKILQIFN